MPAAHPWRHGEFDEAGVAGAGGGNFQEEMTAVGYYSVRLQPHEPGDDVGGAQARYVSDDAQSEEGARLRDGLLFTGAQDETKARREGLGRHRHGDVVQIVRSDGGEGDRSADADPFQEFAVTTMPDHGQDVHRPDQAEVLGAGIAFNADDRDTERLQLAAKPESDLTEADDDHVSRPGESPSADQSHR